jgi:organic radical activating enzyme
MQYTIPIENQLSYRSIPRNKDLKLDIKNHCDFPSRVLVVDRRGHCFVCSCEAWLPISVGQIQNFNELEQVWANPVARALQDDIQQKKFTHCAVDRCGIMLKDQRIVEYGDSSHLKNPNDFYYISVNIDDSCNLSCPSCRKNMVMITQGKEFDQRLAQVNHLIELLEKFDHACHITMTGNGDPLASAIMRPLIHQYRPRHNHTIRLFTNGLLLKKQLADATIVNNITQFFISLDAGSAEVYEQVRRPGKFDMLISNLDFLRELVDQTQATVLLKFVLQQDNYNDMENFVNLCMHYKFSGVINRLEDWGTWDDFTQKDVVGNQLHPLHLVAVENLKKVYNAKYPGITFNPSLINICQS